MLLNGSEDEEGFFLAGYSLDFLLTFLSCWIDLNVVSGCVMIKLAFRYLVASHSVLGKWLISKKENW